MGKVIRSKGLRRRPLIQQLPIHRHLHCHRRGQHRGLLHGSPTTTPACQPRWDTCAQDKDVQRLSRAATCWLNTCKQPASRPPPPCTRGAWHRQSGHDTAADRLAACPPCNDVSFRGTLSRTRARCVVLSYYV